MQTKSGVSKAIYGFIECTVSQFMTWSVVTMNLVPHYNELRSRPASEVMTEAVVHVDSISPSTRVLQLMVNLEARSFPVSVLLANWRA